MPISSVPVLWDAAQLLHAPTQELSEGEFIPYPESPARAEAIRAALARAPWAAFQAPGPLDEALLLRVHDRDYAALIREAWAAWRAEGNAGDAKIGRAHV